MPPAATAGAAPDVDRISRRAVWAVALVVVLAAGVAYADKAGDDRSAFVRWRPQVLQFWRGVNVYERMTFPNPPVLPITLYPLMTLPPLEGALAWFAIKAGLTALSVAFCFAMVRPGGRALPAWVQAAILLLSARPILGDLHHGNINLLILFLIVSCLLAWRQGRDVAAGLLLGLAIAYKVTPALFVPYFLYKRSYRTVAATFLGLGLFLVVVPSLVVGPGFNGVCLAAWWQKMLSPFVAGGVISAQEVNQSLGGVLTRLLTAAPAGVDRDGESPTVNLLAMPPGQVGLVVKGLSAGLVALLAWLCRTRTDRRNDHRLFGEFSLVVLAMLFLSERSWKHHYVTLLLPYTYLMYRVGVARIPGRVRAGLAAAVVLSALLMATTSSELGGLFDHHRGHKIAQGYGMFLWAGVVLFVATTWQVRAESEAEAAETAGVGDDPPRGYRWSPLPGV